MTPASERARQIERDEFEAERIAVRARALSYSKECRQREREQFEAWLCDGVDPKPQMPDILAIHRKSGVQKSKRASAMRAKTYTAFGRTRTSREWAAETGIEQGIISSRLRQGWSVERALSLTTQSKEQRQRNAATSTEVGGAVGNSSQNLGTGVGRQARDLQTSNNLNG